MAPSVGSQRDAYVNALAESVIGLYKTEVIRHAGPWRGLEDVEFATLEWAAWFDQQRLLEPLGYGPPAEFEEQCYREQAARADLVALTYPSLLGTRGGSVLRIPVRRSVRLDRTVLAADRPSLPQPVARTRPPAAVHRPAPVPRVYFRRSPARVRSPALLGDMGAALVARPARHFHSAQPI